MKELTGLCADVLPKIFHMFLEFLVLIYFSWPFCGRKKKTSAALFLLPAAFALLSVLLQELPVFYSLYGSMLFHLAVFTLFLCLWLRQPPLASLYLAMIFFLAENYLNTLAGFLSQKLLGIDVMMDGAPGMQAIGVLFLAGILLAVCAFLRFLVSMAGSLMIRWQQAFIMAVAVLPYFFIRGIVYWLPLQNEELHGEIPVILFITALVALILIIGNVNMISAQRHRYELSQMEQINRRIEENYRHSSEMIENVNRHYHDLKHMLGYLLESADQPETRRFLSQAMEQIRPYETVVTTGNHAVDITMSEKLAECRRLEISCIPNIDGRALDFAAPADLCILLGNAMDNAIHACGRIPDPEQRQIQIRTTLQNGMVLIRVSNPCADAPREQNGRLLTSHSDVLSHGYGMRSMEKIAGQYGGHVSWKLKDGWFILDILLFPPDAS